MYGRFDLSEFHRLATVCITAEFLLDMNDFACTYTLVEQAESHARISAHLPPALEILTFYDTPQRNRESVFWFGILRNILSNRAQCFRLHRINLIRPHIPDTRCNQCQKPTLDWPLRDEGIMAITEVDLALEDIGIRPFSSWQVDGKYEECEREQRTLRDELCIVGGGYPA